MLSKLYSNKDDLFQPIDFVDGLNVILAEIRLPENQNRDTHNLGKSVLGKLLNFCFLATKNKDQFLFKHEKIFSEFIFFLELKLFDGSFVTLCRSIESPSKVSFYKHTEQYQDCSGFKDEDWDHSQVPFERAKSMLDSYLDWSYLKPWGFRNGLGYLLRSQDDYKSIVQLSKYAGSHSKWKPQLAHILGFNSSLIKDHYNKEDELEAKIEKEKTVKAELGGSIEDFSKIEGVMRLKQADINNRQNLLDDFDFKLKDKESIKVLVDDIDGQLADLNSRRYTLTYRKKKINVALREGKILFDPDEVKRLYDQAGILFDGQIKKDFEQLISFNKSITEERRSYLKEELIDITKELKKIVSSISSLSSRRVRSLQYLGETDVVTKYKAASEELIELKADLAVLAHKKSFLAQLQKLRREIRSLKDEVTQLQILIEEDSELQNSGEENRFSSIRKHFSDIVEHVVGEKAVLSVAPDENGHLQYSVDMLDSKGKLTSADEGHTYKKLLCIAFDYAVLRAHLVDRFPRFVYHDGVFESLDDRKKIKLLEVIHEYTEFGLQPIITLIDSDLPRFDDGDEHECFDPDAVVLTLHDEDDQGKLFKMASW